MGILSDLFRFREAGEPANRNNVEEFGAPARSLFTSTEIFTLHHRIEITDESGNVVYRAQTQFPSLHDKTNITDADGRQVAHIESKLFSLHERHFVDMADGTSFELSNELFHIINDITNIEGLGWQLRGDILALDFRLYDENDQLLANISQKFLSLHAAHDRGQGGCRGFFFEFFFLLRLSVNANCRRVSYPAGSFLFLSSDSL